MALELTEMQKKAVDEGGNILVAAAAGSGKTAVLVERVIKMLTRDENPISADRLLIVTFTNAAAAEMRQRIEKRLNEECEKKPDNIALLKQRLLLSSADICTIDSFCINLIRENFELCGIEPSFKVGDDSLTAPIKQRVINEICEQLIAENSPEFNFLLNILNCEYDETNFIDTIKLIYEKAEVLPYPEKFFESLLRPYSLKFEKGHPWYDGTFEMAKEYTDTLFDAKEKMLSAAKFIGKGQEKCELYANSLSDVYDTISKSFEKNDWNGFRLTVFEANAPRVPSTEGGDTYGEIFKSEKKRYAESLAKLQGLFINSAEENEALNQRLFPAVKLLTDTVLSFKKKFFEELKKENVFTFSDIEQLALGLLLGDSEHINDIKAKYDEVLVDEFQDVNDLQNMLFYVLSSNEEHLFAVGDVKQSIYAFRGANPENFLKKKNSYIPVSKATECDSKKIILSDNFRSRKGICDFINFFFSHLMNGEVGGIVYDKEEYLYAGGKFPECDEIPVDLLLCDKTDDLDFSDRLHFEARAIGEYIRELLQKDAFITADKELRRANYGDIVILLDSMKEKSAVIAEELKKLNIPVSLSSESFFESVEVKVLLSLLKVVNNPKNDVELLTVLMSPIFGFSAEEIAFLRIPSKKTSLFSAVVNAANNQNKRASDFLKRLNEMRALAAVMPLGRFISRLITDTDYLNIVSAMPSGDIKRENLLTIKRLAEGYQRDFDGGISGFCDYLAALPEKSIKPKTSTQNAVRIMSMHSSKGLQFPVCILGNLAGKINSSDSFGNILFDETNGLAVKYTDDNEEIIKTAGHPIISKNKYVQGIEERMRLLYVALTRAEDKLCLVSSSGDAMKTINGIASALNEGLPRINSNWLKSTKNMNEWVIAAALLHPDSSALKKTYDTYTVPEETDSRLNVIIKNKPFEKTDIKENKEEINVNYELSKKIKENADYVYPYTALREIQAKSSVSLLAHKAENDRFAFCERPDFMFKNGLSGAAKGTAMHHIMQFIDISKKPDVSSELERLLEWQFINEAERNAADIKAIESFFESDLFERISASKNVKREMRFLSEVKAKSIDPTLPDSIADTEVIIQGAVDLCFEEEDGVVVVDFKTDRVNELSELKETYSEQLNIYSKACERIFERPVKERIIYSFHLSKEITV